MTTATVPPPGRPPGELYQARKFRDAAPADACRCQAARFTVLSREVGPSDETVPIEIVARSAETLNHWWWGRVVHDLSGFSTKTRIPIDYAHDDREIIGYLDRFTVDARGLVAHGALILTDSPGDRATEVVRKGRLGVPWEASIYFDADHGLVVEEVATGAETEVNGTQFAGPGVVIRKWQLRGVAVCPYGYDAATQSVLSRPGGDRLVRITTNQPRGSEPMTTDELTIDPAADPAEDQAQAEQELATEAQAEDQATETPPNETPPNDETEDQAADETPPTEAADEVPPPATAATAAPRMFSADDAARFKTRFGLVGLEWLVEGLSYDAALERHVARLEADNKRLTDRLAAAGDLAAADPVDYQPPGEAPLTMKDLVRIAK